MIVVWDIETIRLATAIAPDGKSIGWKSERLHHMGISIACTWRSDTGETESFWGSDQADVARLVNLLETASLVVDYNGKQFDRPLLEGLIGRNLHIKRHLDLLEVIRIIAGRRYKLDEIAEINLGIKKSGFGGHAPQLFADDKLEELEGYCKKDVFIEKALYFYMWTWGELKLPNDRKVSVPVDLLKGRK